MLEQRLAESFPVGGFLAEELDERGWTVEEFAIILGLPDRLVEDIIAGQAEISPRTARRIGAALGTSTQLWLNLQDRSRGKSPRDDYRDEAPLNDAHRGPTY